MMNLNPKNKEEILYEINKQDGVLVLENGMSFQGHIFGHIPTQKDRIIGEVVFQTGMVGYPESMTDPSYRGQILVLTYPMIGNYGIPNPNGSNNDPIDPYFESDSIHITALVVGELETSPNETSPNETSPNETSPAETSMAETSLNETSMAEISLTETPETLSHRQAHLSLDQWMKMHQVTGITGIDTRKLTQILREKGTLKGYIAKQEDQSKQQDQSKKHDQLSHNPTIWDNLSNSTHLVDSVTTSKIRRLVSNVKSDSDRIKVMVIDCGLKNNQLRMLLEYNVELIIVPWNHNFLDYGDDDEILNINSFDRIFISNGPGDPQQCQALIDNLAKFIEINNKKIKPIPIFGICLGHQILALAAGNKAGAQLTKTYKMKYGNRGQNIPCRLIGTNKCYITSQNHGYAVDADTLPSDWLPLFRNENDGSNEGIIHAKYPYFSVQFHPEGKTGPTDTRFLFDIFVDPQGILGSKNHLSYSSIDDLRKNCFLNKNGENTQPTINYRKVLILGSGGLNIGQSGEFDYSGSQAIKAYKEEGLTTILVNPNIATIQTSPGFSDKVYFLPINVENVQNIIEAERPDCLTVSFGGQTALNCGIELYQRGILEKYQVQILGTPIESVIDTEDRDRFTTKLKSFGEHFIQSQSVTSINQGIQAAQTIGYPVLVRSAFALGGLGSGFANNDGELEKLLEQTFAYSTQAIIDKSLQGWKELEYEVVRDQYDNCITVCNMENFDPLGIHTGDSIVVAPSQTLTDTEYQMLRRVAINTVRKFGIIGECNIQYALDPHSLQYYIVEINARLSRSSALASKATGYPLAYIAAKLSLGYALPDLKNSITKTTSACFEPSLDYCVVKMPRWDLQKFGPHVDKNLNSSMKSIGEAMAIARNFEEAFQKAIRMANENRLGFDPISNKEDLSREYITKSLREATPDRIFIIAYALYYKVLGVKEIYQLTKIDFWFLNRLARIIEIRNSLENTKGMSKDLLLIAKKTGFSDKQISQYLGKTELTIRQIRKEYWITPKIKQIDTVSAEFPCYTNYLYLTYNATEHDQICQNNININNNNNNNKSTNPTMGKIMVLGSGVYKIGSSVEFDWCAVNCIRELRKLGKETIVVNCNPETVSTDFDEADKLFFEELSFETVLDIFELENPNGIILSMGGQLPNNIAMALFRQNIPIIGTSPEMIDRAENRYKFSRMLDEVKIDQPVWRELTSIAQARKFCQEVGYPCLVRPSYVLSGSAMNVAYSDEDLKEYLENAVAVSKDYPVVISKYILDAKEIEVDAVSHQGRIIEIAISEHVENAGVHSGDSTLILPAQDITKETLKKIKYNTAVISKSLNINGPFNIQFIAKDDQVKVIECNLRVSRSFPFVSKTLGTNFIQTATRLMLDMDLDAIDPTEERNIRPDVVGVKVPKFSFDRLRGADINLGVEMMSTGEVACFGENKYQAYLKGLLASGFRIPNPQTQSILLSIGSYRAKAELKLAIKTLVRMGYRLYGTQGTADYYSEHDIPVQELPIQEFNYNNHEPFDSILNLIGQKENGIGLVINISIPNKIFNPTYMSSLNQTNGKYPITNGYLIRRKAIDSNIPVITDIKAAKFFISSLEYYFNYNISNNSNINSNISANSDSLTLPNFTYPLNNNVDCLTTYKIIRLPGLIDIHVHMREPGDAHKENWASGTKAALAGGITTILAMPNTNPAVTDYNNLKIVQKIAQEKAYCDWGLYMGANSFNWETVSQSQIISESVGLKMYLNNTFGDLLLENSIDWYHHLEKWPKNKPVCVHAEGPTLAAVLHLANLLDRQIHICHVARKEEIELIRLSKEAGMKVTCEVSPHHLFLNTENTTMNPLCCSVKPSLMRPEDQKALWDNMDIIDCFATDHAPHTWEEKNQSEKFVPGFPGLETALPLLLSAVKQGQLSLEDIIAKYHTNPGKIFGIPTDENTYIEIDLDKKWTIPKAMNYSKSQWTPFEGMEVYGEIKKVVLRGKVVMVEGQIIGESGYGRNIASYSKLNNTNIRKRNNKLQHTNSRNKITSPTSFLELTSPLETDNESEFNLDLDQVPKEPQIEIIPRFKHILDVEQFDRPLLKSIFDLSSKMKKFVEEQNMEIYNNNTNNQQDYSQILKGKVIATVFYEPSTRTKCSFNAAIQRLGGNIMDVVVESSSIQKGESFSDFMRTLESYTDMIILRSPMKNFISQCPEDLSIPIINAGDGVGEHPTQALLDVYTIREERGTVTGLTITMLGDLKHSRTVHSLAKLLAVYDGIRLRYVAPSGLEMPEEIKQYVQQKNINIEQTEHQELHEVLAKTDVLYVTRLQKERFLSIEEYQQVLDSYIITAQTLSLAKENLVIMHPLPRNNEISTEIDTDHRAAYFRQMKNGLYVRMALLKLLNP